MDVSFRQYCHLTPEETLDKLRELRREVEKYQGDFILLWHNSSFQVYFWRKWNQVYGKFLMETPNPDKGIISPSTPASI